MKIIIIFKNTKMLNTIYNKIKMLIIQMLKYKRQIIKVMKIIIKYFKNKAI